MNTQQASEPVRSKKGRPPAVEAGLVEERVLETATQLFLEQGFGRTTLDKVSRLSQTGKSTLYGRYPDKEALFAAVVRRSIQAMFSDMAAIPSSGGVRERLRHVGLGLAANLLVPRCIALMRITAAEAENFPDLARMAYRVSHEGSVRCVVDALAPEAGEIARAQATRTAERFVELTLQPVSFQATFGSDPAALRARCVADIEDAITLLAAKGLIPA